MTERSGPYREATPNDNNFGDAMVDNPQTPPQQVSVRAGGAHRGTSTAVSGGVAGLTAPNGPGTSEVTGAAQTIERPVGGIDVLYFEDDPSDMELVLELSDGQVVAVALTEMKATRLRRALDAQQQAAALMRHELAGGTPDTFEPVQVQPAPPSAPEFERDPYDDPNAEYGADDELAESDETLTVRERVNRRMDVAGVRDVAGEAMDKDVRGIPVWWFVIGVLAVSMVLSVISTLSGWL